MTDNKPRICILISNSFSGFHGSSLQAQGQAEQIAKLGFQVTIITHSHKNGGLWLKTKQETVNGVDYHNLTSLWFGKSLTSMLLITLYLIKIHSAFDILQIITSHFCYTGFMLSRLFHKKFIIVSTSDRGYLVKPGLFSRLKFTALKSAEVIVTKTTRLANIYREAFSLEPKIITIFNGVELKSFCVPNHVEKLNAKLKIKIETTDKLLLFVGHLRAEKGLDSLIEQAISNQAELENIKLICVGNKALDRDFVRNSEEKIKGAGLSDKILIIDGNRDIASYYQASDIFVLPSKREGLPNVVLEAMACGVPCIVSKLGYTDDVITKDNGCIFSLDNPTELWDNVKKLLADEKLRTEMGNQARIKIETEFSIELIAKQYADLYQHIMN